jgi:hypothetical protein
VRSHFKELTPEEEAGGHIVSRTVLFPVYPVLQWLDESGDFHHLMLCGSDLVWLSKMHIAIEERKGLE